MDLTSKGGIVVTGNGNGWIGPGHMSVATDLSGQDWLVYHAIPSDDPDLKPADNGTLELTRRPMLIDRLDWIGGWPTVRAGAGPSPGSQPAPVTGWDAGSTFNDGSLSGWRPTGTEPGGWSLTTGPDAGRYVTHTGTDAAPAFLVSSAHASTSTSTSTSADLRAEADLEVPSASGAAGLTVDYRDADDYVAAWLDRPAGALVTDAVVNGVHHRESSALPADFSWDTWQNVSVEVRGGVMTTEVSADRLNDAVTDQTRRLPPAAARPGAVGTASRGGTTASDNVGAVKLFTPVTSRVPTRRPEHLLPGYSDDFTGGTVPGTTPDSPWTWVRGPAAGVSMADGALSWPTQNGDLNLTTDNASVLTRPAPPGDYTVETEIHFAPTKAAQQAGLVLYQNDDRYFKLTHTALPLNDGNGAQVDVTEFGKEGERPTYTPPQPVAYGRMFGGPTADTMWLRLTYHADTARDQNDVSAATSTDGSHWVDTGVWTLPITGPLRIGLVSMNTAGAVARFDYVHVYRD
jgi:regulation of enolase protein 1 (concanavalin A-like superfamily)